MIKNLELEQVKNRLNNWALGEFKSSFYASSYRVSPTTGVEVTGNLLTPLMPERTYRSETKYSKFWRNVIRKNKHFQFPELDDLPVDHGLEGKARILFSFPSVQMLAATCGRDLRQLVMSNECTIHKVLAKTLIGRSRQQCVFLVDEETEAVNVTWKVLKDLKWV